MRWAMLVLLASATVASAAVTREQIMLEQCVWHQGVSGSFRGERIWSPVGSDRWLVTELRQFTSNMQTCRCIMRSQVCRCKAGTYVYVGGTGGSGVTFTGTGSNWYSGDTAQGWTFWQGNTGTYSKTLVVTTPADCVSVWAIGYPVASAGSCTVASSAGTVIKSTLSTATSGGDFGAGCSSTTYVSPYFVEVARNVNGGTVSFTPSTTAMCRLVGFVCVGAASADPDTGVLDPGSIMDVQYHDWAAAADNQEATGPIGLQVGAGSEFYLGDIYGVHWLRATGVTLLTPAETVTLDGAAWNPTAATWVRTTGTGFVRKITGRCSVEAGKNFTADAGTDVCTSNSHGLSDGTCVSTISSTTLPGGLSASTLYYIRDADANTFKLALTSGGSAVDITSAGSGTHTVYTDVGSYEGSYVFSTSGLTIAQRYTWNARAAAISLKHAGSAPGYCGQWGLAQGWTLGRNPSYSPAWTSMPGPWADDTPYVRHASGCLEMTRGDLIARLTASSNLPGGNSLIIGRGTGDFPKMYCYWRATGDDIAIADGDVSWAVQERKVLTESQARTRPPGGGGGMSTGGVGF